jgi:hypothetical protein
MTKMILIQLEFKPKREKIAMETPPTKLSLKDPEMDSARIRNLPSLLRWLFLKDLTNLSKKRRDLHLTMVLRKVKNPRMTLRKRRDLKPSALILMRKRRESLRNSRMESAMAMKLSAKRDSSSFPSQLLAMSTPLQLVFFKLKTQKSTS